MSSVIVSTQNSPFFTGIVSVLSVLILTLARPSRKYKRIHNFLASVVGCLCVQLHPLSYQEPLPEIPRVIIGDVCSPVRTSRDMFRFTICTPGGNYVVRTKQNPSLHYLDRIKVTADFSIPEPPRNPGEFDYQWWCRMHHVNAISATNSRIEIVNSIRNPLIAFVTDLRNHIDSVCKSHLPEATAPLASGILLSIVDELPFEIQEAFGRTGTVHVLSTSGMHISVLVSSIGVILVWTGRSVSTMAGVGMSLMLGFASGGGPAPMRAVSSLLSRLLARFLIRSPEPWHGLCIGLNMAMLKDPFVVMDVGAQLSFVAVAGLILASPLADAIGRHIRQTSVISVKIGLTLAQGFCVSLVVTLITAPTVAYHMMHLSIVSPLANIPIGFLSEWALITGGLAILASPLPVFGIALWSLLNGLLLSLTWTATFLAKAPFADVATGQISPFTATIITVCLIVVFIFIGNVLTNKSSSSEPQYFIPWSPTKSVV